MRNYFRLILRLCVLGITIQGGFGTAKESEIAILYPKPDSLVGARVNLVLDPAADWSATPYFQAVVNGRTEYPVVDTSTGRHACQGLDLKQGINTITVRFFVAGKNAQGATVMVPVKTRDVRVYNREGSFAAIPAGSFREQLFHSREHEEVCNGCHRMDAGVQDEEHKKPEDVLCYTCHRNIPSGSHVHGPAAVWFCVGCHDPGLYPVKYQFSSSDPWTVNKSIESVGPLQYTISSRELFNDSSADLVSREKALQLLGNAIEHLKGKAGEKIRIEAHTDNGPPAALKKGRKFKSNKALSEARANAVAELLSSLKLVSARQIISTGMGDTLPKADNATAEGREINNRIEIVVYPSDETIVNSQKVSSLQDRRRILVKFGYAQGPQIRKFMVIEKIANGFQYLPGSGSFKGRMREPKVYNGELTWDLGDMDATFSETLSYVVKSENRSAPPTTDTKVTYAVNGKEITKNFDYANHNNAGSTVKAVCLKCHGDILAKTYQHGPVAAGYCTLCHDPHGSNHAAWLRKPSWALCTTCHTEKASGVHVVAGISSGNTHPTRLRRDPLRPGKRLSCASCHDPHSGESNYFFIHDIKNRFELCKPCHPKK